MYKVMIIDDEMLIREGIKTIIDWESLGFQVTYEAKDGITGEELIMEHNPDLVLIDIRMPGQSGLDMLANTRASGFDGIAIILTGYSDFEYAREALSIGSDDYLLKPINEELFEKTLRRLKMKLDDKHEQMVKDVEYTKTIGKDILWKLLQGINLTKAENTSVVGDDFLSQSDSYWVCVLHDMKREDMNDDIWLHKVIDGDTQVKMIHGDDGWVLILRNKNYRQIQSLLMLLVKKYEHQLNQEAFVVVSQQRRSYQKLSECYREVLKLNERRFMYKYRDIVFFEETLDEPVISQNDIMDKHYIMGLIEVGNDEALEVYMSKLRDNMTSVDMTTEMLKGICIQNITEIREDLTQRYGHKIMPPEKYNYLIDVIYQSIHLKELMNQLYAIFLEMSELICNGSSDHTVQRILAYVDNNYHRPLKLEGIANLFHYNRSYLGKLIKDETGKFFGVYLDELRIGKSKELLENSDLKVYEVAEKVGYKDVDYFFIKFKKYMGCSPRNYRQTTHQNTIND